MTQEHPITPSTELVKQWLGTYFSTTITGEVSDIELTLATQAARWAADQELEACCEWLSVPCPSYGRELRNARRSKPPSLKEQALDALENLNGDCLLEGFECPEKVATIRRALESLPD
jgi:hypothetical protein